VNKLTDKEITLIQDALLFFEHAMQDSEFSKLDKYYDCATYYQFEKKIEKLVTKLEVMVP